METNIEQKYLSPDELKNRTQRFYVRYGKELEQIACLLQIKLQQLSFAYTLNQKLPQEAVKVTTRVKSIESFLKKLENDNWPTYYYPTEVIHDLIGARVVCWFVDDCYGILNFIKESNHFTLANERIHPIKDYIKTPKDTGYRAIHVFANVIYDRAKRTGEIVTIEPEKMLCEIQIRTKLQDSWGDITHEFFYKAKAMGIEDKNLEAFLADVSTRLSTEDITLEKFRDTYTLLVDKKTIEGRREGFKD